MNREQRRRLKHSKTMRKNLERLLTQIKKEKEAHFIPEGTKVRLRYDRIVSAKNQSEMSERYKAFVEANKESVLTVEYDDKFINKPLVVCLKEDTNEPKWFFSVIDLEVIENED